MNGSEMAEDNLIGYYHTRRSPAKGFLADDTPSVRENASSRPDWQVADLRRLQDRHGLRQDGDRLTAAQPIGLLRAEYIPGRGCGRVDDLKPCPSFPGLRNIGQDELQGLIPVAVHHHEKIIVPHCSRALAVEQEGETMAVR